jgi:hypothetical protein
MKKMLWFIAAVLCAGLVAVAYTRCVPRKLDETVFYDGPVFKLKLVRYYENLPLHYTGEVFRVQCSSARNPGWVTIGNGGAIGSTSAEELVSAVRAKYFVMDANTLVWKGTVLKVSFDGCGTFRYWDPTTLPKDLIDPVHKPDYCAPKGKADCRYYDFHGDREPRFDQIRADSSGQVSFLVRSKAFKGGAVYHVGSNDYGKTWRVNRVESNQ